MLKRNNFEIEICANSIESVFEAEKGGADRVELCESIHEGGTTPSFGLMSLAKEKTNIDVFALIRARGGNFVYSNDEMSIMLRDIRTAINLGVDGIVIGCLKSDGNIDYNNCSRLIEASRGLPITFHRAFDICNNPFETLEVIHSMGIQRILTSGQQNKAIDGIELLAQLQQAAPKDLKIMVASGVDESNIREIARKTKANSFHTSLRVEIPDIRASQENKVKFNSTKDIPENERKITSSERVRNLIKTLETLTEGL